MALLWADILGKCKVVLRLAGGVAHEPLVQPRIDDRSIRAQVALFEDDLLIACVDHAAHREYLGGNIVRVGEFGNIPIEQIGRVVAGHAAEHAVDAEVAQIAADDARAHWSVIESQPKILVHGRGEAARVIRRRACAIVMNAGAKRMTRL